jgi:hypothetical protein
MQSEGAVLATLSMRDTAGAIYVFADAEAAWAALGKGKAEFDKAALRFARNIEVAALPAIVAAIGGQLVKGLSSFAGSKTNSPAAT